MGGVITRAWASGIFGFYGVYTDPGKLKGGWVACNFGAPDGVSCPVAEVLRAAARAFCASPPLVPVAGLSYGRNGSSDTGRSRGPGKSRRDPRSGRGSRRCRWGLRRRLDRPTVMGHSSCLHAGTVMHVGACVLYK